MYKFTIGSLEIVIYLVARITKNGKPFYVKCTRGEWDPRPEVEYQLFRVIEITRDKESDLKYWFEVGTGQGPIDPLDWEAGDWWKYSSPYKVTLRVALDQKTNEVFKVGAWEQNGRWVLNVEHHDEPVEQQVKPVPKPVPAEPVYQVVEVIKPRHVNGNGRPKDEDRRGKSRDFRRARNAAPDRDDERTGGHKEDSPNSAVETATDEETAKALADQHELVGRMDLSGLPKSEPANVN